jgi:hypothetical protein
MTHVMMMYKIAGHSAAALVIFSMRRMVGCTHIQACTQSPLDVKVSGGWTLEILHTLIDFCIDLRHHCCLNVFMQTLRR